MSKALLIVILVAILLGIGGLVWWQLASYDAHERQLKQQLQEEQQIRLKNQPFVPGKTSSGGGDPHWGRGLMGAYL